MSDNSNEKQLELINTIDGPVLVDAGPGTGKTTTITKRYVNIINHNVNPNDILMLTFTRNAASEMTDRIKQKLISSKKTDISKHVISKTFDSFCKMIVSENSERVGEFFGIDSKLSRNIHLESNATIIKSSFRQFYDGFLNDRGEDYGDIAIVLNDNSNDVLDTIGRLMSLGIVPLKKGWFGLNAESALTGNLSKLQSVLESMDAIEQNEDKSKKTKLCTEMNKKIRDNTYERVLPGLQFIGKNNIEQAVYQNRDSLINFIHDVYLAYIKNSIDSGILTFSLNAIFAYVLLYDDEKLRERNSFRYVMIDEFQDTNTNQMMIAMMILKEPNLCVVGDWKQGIYGFRYVSIENITDFKSKLDQLKAFLNEDKKRIKFSFPEPRKINFDTNYRSSQTVVDEYFRTLTIKGTNDEGVKLKEGDECITYLKSEKGELNKYTGICYYSVNNKDEEVKLTIECVKNYLCNDSYKILDDGNFRSVKPSDIAVICRTNKACRMVQDALYNEHIPAYFQGDKCIMSTKEGKLVLAWLRYVNDDNDIRGLFTILAHEGYTLSEMKHIKADSKNRVPPHIVELRNKLRKEKRRINLVLTKIFSYYNLENDITQSIISVISSSHRNSLLTISDVISMIEKDIEEETPYPLEVSLDSESVTVMSAHSSKGLEFPIVIVPFMDQSIFPSTTGEKSLLRLNELSGIRCTDTIGDFDGYKKICKSLDYAIISCASQTNYDEERRLLFVVMSRAKQYISVISGNKPSKFFKEMSENCGCSDLPQESDYNYDGQFNNTIKKPEIKEYKPRKTKWPVHEIMNLGPDGTGSMNDERIDEVNFRGPLFGTKIHQDAQRLVSGLDVSITDENKDDLEYVKKIIDGCKDADIRNAEVPCILPVPGTDVILLGSIDMIALYPDRIEIHDWKTDAMKDRIDEYKIQLSVYAHSAEGFYKKPVKCLVHYTAHKETIEFYPLPVEDIVERVNTVKRNRLLY